MNARLHAASDVVAARRAGGVTAAHAAIGESRVKESMDDVRRRVAEMQSEEQRLLAVRAAALTAGEHAEVVITAVGSLLAFLLVALMLWRRSSSTSFACFC